MNTHLEIELYVFNCIARYDPILRKYKDDALQEIRYSILTTGSEKEALRKSQRACRKMLRQFGNVPFDVKRRYTEYCVRHHKINETQSIFY